MRTNEVGRACSHATVTRRRGPWALLAAAVLGLTLLVTGYGPPAGAHSPHDAVGDVEVSPEFAQDGVAYSIVREYLLKTVDGGESWSRLNRGLDNRHNLSAVEVGTQDPALLFASTRGDGVYRSDDAGASWAKVVGGLEEGLNMPLLFLSPHDDDLLYGITNEGVVWRTSDGGGRWAPVEGFDSVATTVGFAPDDPDIVFVGTEDGLSSSDDGGGSWSEVAAADGAHVDAVALSPTYTEDRTLFLGTAEDGVLRSVDGGQRFTDDSRGLTDGRVQDLEISPGFAADGEVLVSTWLDGVFRTVNRGDTWERVSDGLSTNGQADELERPHFTGLASAQTEPEATIFVAGFNGLFRSQDDAASWQELPTQDSTNIAALALSPNFAEDGTVFVATYLNGAVRSQDRGDTWTPINDGLAFEYDYLRAEDYYTRLTTIAVSPDFASDRMVWTGVRGYLFDSDDAGDEWNASTPPVLVGETFPPDYLIPAFSPDFTEDRTIFAGTDGGQFLRWEAGQPPEKVSDVGPEILSVAVSPGLAEDGTIIAATKEGISRSTDEGETWEHIEGTPKGLTSMSMSSGFPDDGTAFAGTANRLIVTRDGGDTWRDVQSDALGERPYVEAVVTAPDFHESGIVLVSLRGRGLFRSTDGGETFSQAGTDLLADNVVLASFYHSTSEPIVFSPDFAEDQTVFGMAQDTVYRSTDGGESWAALDIPRATHPVTAASAPNELLVIPRTSEEAETLAPQAGGGGGVTAQARSSSDYTILTLSTKRVLAALAAALVAFGLLWLVKLGSRTSKERLAMGLRAACAGLVFAVALFFLSNR